MGIVTYGIKQRVLGLEGELSKINKEIFRLEESKGLLKAEWSYLNEPERLQQLAQKYLTAAPSRGVQIVSLDDLPEKYILPEDQVVRLASAREISP